MKMVAVREIKKNPAILYSGPGYRILTSNNRPKALCFPLDELDDIEEIVASFRQAQAMRAVERARSFAVEKELDGMTMEDIDEEIHRARRGEPS